jgi:PAS domain S-box-containing protein
VQIKAIIQKSETGNDDNLLFKGLIRRVDTISSASKIKRMGFDDNCVLELKKDGTIISVNEAVFKMLGYMSENIAEEYIGQPIETLIPPISGNNRQDKNYWMPLALSNTDLNFYILMVTKSFGLLPVTFALSMKSSEVILMRVRDLTTTDAVVSIDDLGTILTFNEDGHILLGFDADEIMGKNIKCIMQESIAANHDGYLQRYNDTRVARVVGIPRVISTIHRDGSIIPIEIQVNLKDLSLGS